MKTMTCNQLGGACDMKFSTNTFDEMEELSKAHGMEMFQKRDSAHLKAMQQMKDLMQTPTAINEWFEAKRAEFDKLPED